MPFHSEPLVGHLLIHARKGLKLYKQLGPKAIQHENPHTYENGQYHISLDRNLGTYWLILK